MNKAEKIQKLAEKIKGMRNTMFITIGNSGEIHGRPMAIQEETFDGVIWFMTSRHSSKVDDIRKNPKVGLMYGDANGVRFASICGRAELVEDKAKVHEFWNDFYKAWFEGEDDPDIQLVKVTATSAEYWDYKGGKLGVLIDMAKSAITNQPAEGGENERFDF